MGDKTPSLPIRSRLTGLRYVDLVPEPAVELWRSAVRKISTSCRTMHPHTPAKPLKTVCKEIL